MTTALPKGAGPILRKAKTRYGQMRRYGVRGTATPPPEYFTAREEFIDCLEQLRELKVPQTVTADRLGVNRVVVAQWLSKRKTGTTQSVV